jgi:hypothetical protein
LVPRESYLSKKTYHFRDLYSAPTNRVPLDVLFADEQGDFASLDQVNIGPIPRETTGVIEIRLRDKSTGRGSNPVTGAVQ